MSKKLVLIKSVISDKNPSKGQKHRSSINFSTEGAPSNCVGFKWGVAGTEHPELVEFEVMEDKTGHDPTIFSSLEHESCTKSISKGKLYIANPSGCVDDKFQINVYAELPVDCETVNYDNVKYNQVRAKASHNSYLRKESISDQLRVWDIRSIELDIHTGNDWKAWDKLEHNWYVYHVCVSILNRSSVRTFSDALAELVKFNEEFPDHEVITVAIDLKDSFDSEHTVEDLDGLINEALPNRVYKPEDFLGSNSNLQQSAWEWPLLKDLRGKFIFICTTGNLENEDEKIGQLNQYTDNGATANSRTCFVAPEISEEDQIKAHNYAVFFNMKTENSEKLGPAVKEEGFVSRGYGGDDEGNWNKAINGKNHLIGTDKVNTKKDPWATTEKVKQGWPFEGIDIAINPKTVLN
jgi:hypothetical protein